MEDTKKKEQTSTHKIGIYLWIWGLLFVLSFFSYMVDWYQFQGMLRWSLILFFMFFILISLGMFMDATSMMLITVPIFFPLADQLGFDLVWFGLFVLMTFEMAGTTPPFGLLLYVMLGVAPKGTTLFQVAGAAFPYLVCDAFLIMILIFYPGLALWLPSLM